VDATNDQSFTGQINFVTGGWEEFLADPNAVIMPRSVAEYFGLTQGEEVVIARRTRLGAFNTGTLKIAGIHDTGNYFLKDLVLAHFDYLQEIDLTRQYRDLFNRTDRETATNLFIFFDTAEGLADKRDRLVAALSGAGFAASPPADNNEALAAVTAASPRATAADENQPPIRLTVSTLDEVLGIVATVLGAITGAGALVALILLFIIAVSVFINLRMTINERLAEIGTLRAMGVEAKNVTALFILESTILALIFSLIGAASSLLVIGLASLFLRFPATGDIAVILDAGKLVLIPTAGGTLMVVGVIVLFSAVFSYFPARYGGKIKPVDALARTF
ncbi:MAG TPA: FtsX-like permease family protein, partial [Spirochaetia bacterium]|nr:FtsX-like permease family protein [Spirochaetia bacterium]